MKIFDKAYKEAKICEGKKEWYIYFHYRNPETQKWQMFKDRGGLNYKMDPKVRTAFAKDLCKAYNERLADGWSPFGETVGHGDDEYVKYRNLPVATLLREMLLLKKNVLKIRSYQSYKYGIDKLERWLKTNNRLILAEQFTHAHARSFVDWLMVDEKLKNKSVNGLVGDLKAVFNMAVIEREIISKNPFVKIEKLPVEVGKNFPFSDKQKEKLKAAILENRPELWPFVKCIYHLFTRPKEILRLQIIDFDLRSNQVRIHSSIGKNKKQIGVVIPASFLPEVKAWNLKQYPDEWFLFGPGYKPGPVAMSRNTVTMHHSALLDLCKIPRKHTMYAWKHTGNIDSFLAGVDIYDLMRQNRHHSISQTEEYLRSLGLRPNVEYSKKAPKL